MSISHSRGHLSTFISQYSTKEPLNGGQTIPSPPIFSQHSSYLVFQESKKIRISIAFSKLLKMLNGDFVNFMAFQANICLRLLTLFYSHPHFFGNEGAKMVHVPCKFHLHLTCSFRVFIFQIFSYQQKVPIQAAFGCFLDITPRNVVKLV